MRHRDLLRHLSTMGRERTLASFAVLFTLVAVLGLAVTLGKREESAQVTAGGPSISIDRAPGQAAALVGRVLKLPADEIAAKIKGSRNFTWIARKVDADESQRLRAMNRWTARALRLRPAGER
mgnify:CR=1 FL=1